MEIRETELRGLFVLMPKFFEDGRGYFFEAHKHATFTSLGLPSEFVQDNISSSHRGVVRGLHFQKKPNEQGKLVRCLRGAIFDVVVDIRHGSSTFGRMESIELSEANRMGLYVPPGFAHGFQSLDDETLVLYKCTTPWAPQSESGIRYDDSTLAVKWPLTNPILSEKDLKLPSFKELTSAF